MNTAIAIYVFCPDGKNPTRVANEGSYSIRRGDRRGAKRVGDPHLKAEILVLYRYREIAGTTHVELLGPVFEITGPPNPTTSADGRQRWTFLVKPTDTEPEDLTLVVDPIQEIVTGVRGQPVAAITRRFDAPVARERETPRTL